jgi:Protein of unknown function (DUF3617)
MSSNRIWIASLGACLMGATIAAVAQKFEPGEVWQMTMSMKMAGMSMPARTMEQCVAKSQPAAPDMAEENKNCKTTEYKTVGSTTSMKFACTGKDAMTGEGTFTTVGKTMKGQMKMNSGGSVMETSYSSVNTGKACDAKAMERKVNEMVAKSAADLDRQCTEDLTSGKNAAGYMVFGSQAICKDPKFKPMYCAHIAGKGEAGYKRLRGDELMAKQLKEPALLGVIEAGCGVSMLGMQKELCGSAQQRKSWRFLAGSCPAQAKPLAARECAGRGYTALSTSPYKDFCSAYGVGGGSEDISDDESSRSAGSSNTQQAEEAKPESKLKKGLKGLKGVLGR